MIANLARKLNDYIPAGFFRIAMGFWPPFFGAGIYLKSLDPQYRRVEVRLKRRFYNSNYVGTQFGGSIYAMTDPFFMLLIMRNLGPAYIVWDKGAKVDFKSPGKTELAAIFQIDEELLTDIKEKTAGGDKYIFDLPVEVLDREGVVVATVSKTIYVRRKMKKI